MSGSGPYAEAPLGAPRNKRRIGDFMPDGWGEPNLPIIVTTVTRAPLPRRRDKPLLSPVVSEPTYDPDMLLGIVKTALLEDACIPTPNVPHEVLIEKAADLLHAFGVRAVLADWCPELGDYV